jgi:RNA-directed DNA polymerase
MNEPGKSDKPVVPRKPANSNSRPNFWEFVEGLERVEGRGLAKENEDCAGNETGVVFQVDPAKQTDRTRSRLEESTTLNEGLHSALERVRQAACRDKEMKFTSLWHHVYNIERLREAYFALKRNVAAGIDGETWQMYGQELTSLPIFIARPDHERIYIQTR